MVATIQFSSRNTIQRLVDAFGITATVAAVALLLWTFWPAHIKWNSSFDGAAHETGSKPPREAVSLAGAATRGSSTAGVGMIEYSDFQCPFCTRFARETLPALLAEYVDSGRVLIAFRHRPMERIHPFAMEASRAAVCAQNQGRFWEMHDSLFAAPDQVNEAAFIRRAHAIGLQEDLFRQCLASGGARDRVNKDRQFADDLGIRATPSFLFGWIERNGHVRVTTRFSGAQPLDKFESTLNELLLQTTSAR
jgi:protein-disulfide isomerase